MSSKDTQTDPIPYCAPRGDQDLVELARSSGLSDEAAQAVAAIDAVMVRIRRGMLRRDFGRQVLAKLDPTLQHPRCVYQLMKAHFARYTPEMVSRAM